jgi:hypothetical protein
VAMWSCEPVSTLTNEPEVHWNVPPERVIVL